MATRGSYFEMPGLFTPPPAGRSSSRADLFAPIPRFAAATETLGQLTDSGVLAARKRPRHGDASFSTTHTTGAWEDGSLAISRQFNAKSPPPLANDRYELAGGMEGSDNRFGRHNGDYDDYFHLQKQRGMWATPTATPFGRQQHQPTADDVVMQPTPDSATAKPWMINQLMSLVGGVAGKLIHFCSVPFRGFQAGGGQAFDAHGEVAARLGLQDDGLDGTTGAIQRPQLGDYPEDDYGVLSIESVDQEQERPRITKRLRTGESWVVVDKEGEMESRPSTPRLSGRKHARSSSIPRPVSRANTSATPKRPSLIPISRRSTLDRKSFQGTSKPAILTTPRSYTRQNYGSPVMFENKTKHSPLPPDSQRLINKLKREEMEEDARLRRMSSQMSNLLKEAREALGSTIDVYDEMDTSAPDNDYTEKSWYYK